MGICSNSREEKGHMKSIKRQSLFHRNEFAASCLWRDRGRGRNRISQIKLHRNPRCVHCMHHLLKLRSKFLSLSSLSLSLSRQPLGKRRTREGGGEEGKAVVMLFTFCPPSYSGVTQVPYFSGARFTSVFFRRRDYQRASPVQHILKESYEECHHNL